MKKILGILALFILLLCSNSCQNELPGYPPSTDSIPLVKEPDVMAYSGNNLWGSTFSNPLTRSNTHGYYKVQDYQLNDNFKEQNPDLYEIMSHAPSAISDAEWTFVKNYLAEHPDEGSTVCNLTDYFIQWCGKSYDNYYAGKDQNKADQYVTGSNQMDYIEIDNVHLNDYNGSWGPIAYCENWPLVNPAYHDSYGNIDNTKYNMYRFYEIEYNGERGLYLCFDYTTQKDSGEYVEGNGVFNDWVLKITPAKSETLPPVEQEPEEVPEHVEINLSVDRKDAGDWLASHLSIHVRAVTDVVVKIPIPQDYFCAPDDLLIVQKHLEDFTVHGNKEISYMVGETTVTLSIEYDENGITISTSGIDANLIEYCNVNLHDGITFEVWNYYNIIPVELKSYLDQATVTFTNPPELYINAFNKTETGEKFAWDATVSIDDDQRSLYGQSYPDYWYNGSEHNLKYDKN